LSNGLSRFFIFHSTQKIIHTILHYHKNQSFLKDTATKKESISFMNMNTDSFQNFSIKNKKASKTISRVMSWTFIYPVLLLPADSSDQPEA